MDISYYKKYEPVFGVWKITKQIGQGSFGRVFEIERQDFGQTYKAALKIMTVPQNESEVESVMSTGMDEAGASEYFQSVVSDIVSEFAIMSKLKGNSNIVSYEDHQVIAHEAGVGWDIFIRMELLTPLSAHIKNKKLTQNEVIKIGIDICNALELCQMHGIIHRDIKPENIFISDSGNFKLGDFGIARTIEKTSSGLSKKGTYNYMAPEVYRGEAYGAPVDIYSLGMVMHRLLNNNRVPFLPPPPAQIRHSDMDEALARRMGGLPLPAPLEADGRLAELISIACAFHPSQRFSSPQEMRAALEAVLNNRPAVYPAARGGHIPGGVGSNNLPPQPAPAQKSGSRFIIAAAIVLVAAVVGLFLLLGNNDRAPERDMPTATDPAIPNGTNLPATPPPEPPPDAEELEPAPALAEIGDIIEFGGYDWRVLDVQGSMVKVISEYIIENRAYHHTLEAVTWETSDIRRWLNDDFINRFSEADRARIVETTVINNDNPWDFSEMGGYVRTPGGNDTTDMIFLLSIDEVLRYFGDSGEVARGSTMSASEREAYGGDMWWGMGINDQYNDARTARYFDGWYSAWWLRSPGFDSSAAAIIYTSGSLLFPGYGVIWSLPSVRPAMWINLES